MTINHVDEGFTEPRYKAISCDYSTMSGHVNEEHCDEDDALCHQDVIYIMEQSDTLYENVTCHGKTKWSSSLNLARFSEAFVHCESSNLRIYVGEFQ